MSHRTFTRRRVLTAFGAFLLVGGNAACAEEERQSTTSGVAFGAHMGQAPGGRPQALAPWDLHYYMEREKQIGRKHDFLTVMTGWKNGSDYLDFEPRWWDPRTVSRYPILHWTWSPEAHRNRQHPTNFALRPSAIANGEHDAYIDRYADQMKDYGKRIILRFAHEQNGDWMIWSPGFYTRETANTYVAMWRHVRSRFDRLGVSNVEWCWCPNGIGMKGEYESLIAQTYPGDAYVDWVGIDAYNNNPRALQYYTFKQLFEPTYDLLHQIAPSKKLCVPEFGTVENTVLGPDVKARFWLDMKRDLPTYFPKIKWISVWDRNLDGRFRVDTNTASLHNYTDMVNDSYFTTSLTDVQV